MTPQPIMQFVAMATLFATLTGCAAVHTSIAKRNLDVQTRMSDAVFLDPVGPDKRTIFVQVRNTSDKPNFDLEGPIKNAIRGRDYQVLDDPDAAHFKLQAQILSVSKASVTAAEAALNGGYGAPIAGITAGAVAGVATGGSYSRHGGCRCRRRNRGRPDRDDCQCRGAGCLLRGRHRRANIPEGESRPSLASGTSRWTASQGLGGSETTTFSEVTDEKRYRTPA